MLNYHTYFHEAGDWLLKKYNIFERIQLYWYNIAVSVMRWIMNKILLIIPAFNEGENILSTCSQIARYNESGRYHLDFIVINDGSTDDTEYILEENQIPHICLIHNLGIGGAVQAGYKYAYENNYEIAIQFDGDGQHDIHSVDALITPIILDECDFCIGSRFIEGSKSEFKSSKARRMGINLISFFIKLVTGQRIYDTTSGYRSGNRKIIRDFAMTYPIEYPEPITNTELLKKRYRVKEVPVIMYDRVGGLSSIHSWKNAYYMINILLSILVISIRLWKK